VELRAPTRHTYGEGRRVRDIEPHGFGRLAGVLGTARGDRARTQHGKFGEGRGRGSRTSQRSFEREPTGHNPYAGC